MVRAASQPDNTRACYSKLASKRWIGPRIFGTHSLRRTKAALIYRRTGNLRAVQLLLGHTKMKARSVISGDVAATRGARQNGSPKTTRRLPLSPRTHGLLVQGRADCLRPSRGTGYPD
jgi:hypothetical protein